MEKVPRSTHRVKEEDATRRLARDAGGVQGPRASAPCSLSTKRSLSQGQGRGFPQNREKEFFVSPKPQRTKMGVAEVLVYVCR